MKYLKKLPITIIIFFAISIYSCKKEETSQPQNNTNSINSNLHSVRVEITTNPVKYLKTYVNRSAYENWDITESNGTYSKTFSVPMDSTVTIWSMVDANKSTGGTLFDVTIFKDGVQVDHHTKVCTNSIWMWKVQ